MKLDVNKETINYTSHTGWLKLKRIITELRLHEGKPNEGFFLLLCT